MRLEHRLDPGSGRAPLDPGDDAPFDHKRERRHLPYPKTLREVGPLVHVDAEAVALLPGDMCEQALHPPGRPGAEGSEENELRAFVGGHVSAS